MTSRCLFITSSYSSRCLRMSKFCPSTRDLRLLDRLGHHRVGDDLALLHAQALHDLDMPLRAEQAHQVVFEREEEDATSPGSPWRPARPRSWRSMRRLSWRSVPMMCRPRRLVRRTFGVQLRVLHGQRRAAIPALAAVELDVGAAAGHVGRDRHRAALPGLGHDLGLALVVLGVQHVVVDPAALQQPAEQLADLDRRRAHQHRQAELVQARRPRRRSPCTSPAWSGRSRRRMSARRDRPLVGITTTSSL